MESHQVMLLLGSNLGDRAAVFAAARLRIGETVGPLVAVSREYETEPWGTFAAGERQFPFLNQAVVARTGLSAFGVLEAIQQIERELGRPVHDSEYVPGGERLYRSRTIDIDILFFDSEVIDTERLVVPHPRFPERRFAVEPAAEIWPEFVHPALKISLKDLFNSLL